MPVSGVITALFLAFVNLVAPGIGTILSALCVDENAIPSFDNLATQMAQEDPDDGGDMPPIGEEEDKNKKAPPVVRVDKKL